MMTFMGNAVDGLVNVEAAVEEATWAESHAAGRVDRLGKQLQEVEA